MAKIELQKSTSGNIGGTMKAINESGLPEEKKNELKEKALNALVGSGSTKTEVARDPKSEQFKQRVKTIDDMVKDNIINSSEGEKMKEKETERFILSGEDKTITSLEGIKEVSKTASNDNTDIEVTDDGIKITSFKSTVAGASSKYPPKQPHLVARHDRVVACVDEN